MTTSRERGREVADWLACLVRSKSLTVDEVTTRMGRTDEDLALLMARYTVGDEARLSRARQRAVLGIPGHESEPPPLAMELTEAMRDHVSGTPLDHDVWLHRPEFVETFVKPSGREFYIDFGALADALVSRITPGASETETGILRLVVDLGSDRWRISRMSDTTVHLVQVAVTTATASE